MQRETSHVLSMAIQVITFAAFTLVVVTMYIMCRNAVSTKIYNDSVASVVIENGEYNKYFGANKSITVQGMVGFIALYGDKFDYIIKVGDTYYSTKTQAVTQSVIVSPAITSYKVMSKSLKELNNELYVDCNLSTTNKVTAKLYSGTTPVKSTSSGIDGGTLVLFNVQ